MFCNKVAILSALILLSSGLFSPCMAAQTTGAGEPGPTRMAILPFVMNTPASLNYLQNGIRDMLSSRLSQQGKVQVVDKLETDKAARGAKEISHSEALRIGAALKADYVLYGSIASAGQSVTIDARMVPVSGKTEPVSFYAQTKSLDEIMPQVNLFAQQINQKIFGKTEEKSQAASEEAETLATRNPELLLTGASATADRIGYINPGFVDVTPEGTKPNMWRSQDFPGLILGMDVGDVDGDGKSEIVAIRERKLTVYKKEASALREVATFEGGAGDRFVWVSVVNMYPEAKAYIFLTNLRTKNGSRTSSGTAKLADPGADVSSYVLKVAEGQIQVVAQNVPYFLNAVHLGQRGKVLIGQKQGDKNKSGFAGDIFEMLLTGGSLVPGPAVSVSREANVFNFVKADVKHDKADKVVMVDGNHRLIVVSPSGERPWKGEGSWGRSINSPVADVPPPILIADLRGKGLPEIVLNRNTTSSERTFAWLPKSKKSYDSGEIVSLSWEKKGLTENWRTKPLNGQVTAFRIGDIEGNGTKQLIISMVTAKDMAKLSDVRSVILIYELNVRKGG